MPECLFLATPPTHVPSPIFFATPTMREWLFCHPPTPAPSPNLFTTPVMPECLFLLPLLPLPLSHLYCHPCSQIFVAPVPLPIFLLPF